MPPLDVVTLEGELVRLEPLTLDHTAAMMAAASTDRSTFGLTTVPEANMQSVERSSQPRKNSTSEAKALHLPRFADQMTDSLAALVSCSPNIGIR